MGSLGLSNRDISPEKQDLDSAQHPAPLGRCPWDQQDARLGSEPAQDRGPRRSRAVGTRPQQHCRACSSLEYGLRGRLPGPGAHGRLCSWLSSPNIVSLLVPWLCKGPRGDGSLLCVKTLLWWEDPGLFSAWLSRGSGLPSCASYQQAGHRAVLTTCLILVLPSTSGQCPDWLALWRALLDARPWAPPSPSPCA